MLMFEGRSEAVAKDSATMTYQGICPLCLNRGEVQCSQCNGEQFLMLADGTQRDCPFCEGDGVLSCCSVSNRAESGRRYNEAVKEQRVYQRNIGSTSKSGRTPLGAELDSGHAARNPDKLADVAATVDFASQDLPNLIKLIAPEDEDTYGAELIDLAKRAAKEAMAPDLDALRQELLSRLAAIDPNSAHFSPSPLSPARLATQEDEETYGAEFIDFAKRAAKEAMAPELIGLRQELLSKIASIGLNNADVALASRPFVSLMTPEDEDTYGAELIDLAKRAAGEVMTPELNVLRQEFLSRLATIGSADKAVRSDNDVSDLCSCKPAISPEDLNAIDRYYDYNGTVEWGWEVKNDQDRLQWMDWKDGLKKQHEKEFFPVQTAMFGFGAAAILLTPLGLPVALGIGAVWGGNKLYKEWSKTRTLKAYGRSFLLNNKGVVVGVNKDDAGDGLALPPAES